MSAPGAGPPPEGDDGVPAPVWAKLLLAAVPFVVVLIVLLLLRALRG